MFQTNRLIEPMNYSNKLTTFKDFVVPEAFVKGDISDFEAYMLLAKLDLVDQANDFYFTTKAFRVPAGIKINHTSGKKPEYIAGEIVPLPVRDFNEFQTSKFVSGGDWSYEEGVDIAPNETDQQSLPTDDQFHLFEAQKFYQNEINNALAKGDTVKAQKVLMDYEKMMGNDNAQFKESIQDYLKDIQDAPIREELKLLTEKLGMGASELVKQMEFQPETPAQLKFNPIKNSVIVATSKLRAVDISVLFESLTTLRYSEGAEKLLGIITGKFKQKEFDTKDIFPFLAKDPKIQAQFNKGLQDIFSKIQNVGNNKDKKAERISAISSVSYYIKSFAESQNELLTQSNKDTVQELKQQSETFQSNIRRILDESKSDDAAIVEALTEFALTSEAVKVVEQELETDSLVLKGVSDLFTNKDVFSSIMNKYFILRSRTGDSSQDVEFSKSLNLEDISLTHRLEPKQISRDTMKYFARDLESTLSETTFRTNLVKKFFTVKSNSGGLSILGTNKSGINSQNFVNSVAETFSKKLDESEQQKIKALVNKSRGKLLPQSQTRLRELVKSSIIESLKKDSVMFGALNNLYSKNNDVILEPDKLDLHPLIDNAANQIAADLDGEILKIFKTSGVSAQNISAEARDGLMSLMISRMSFANIKSLNATDADNYNKSLALISLVLGDFTPKLELGVISDKKTELKHVQAKLFANIRILPFDSKTGKLRFLSHQLKRLYDGAVKRGFLPPHMDIDNESVRNSVGFSEGILRYFTASDGQSTYSECLLNGLISDLPNYKNDVESSTGKRGNRAYNTNDRLEDVKYTYETPQMNSGFHVSEILNTQRQILGEGDNSVLKKLNNLSKTSTVEDLEKIVTDFEQRTQGLPKSVANYYVERLRVEGKLHLLTRQSKTGKEETLGSRFEFLMELPVVASSIAKSLNPSNKLGVLESQDIRLLNNNYSIDDFISEKEGFSPELRHENDLYGKVKGGFVWQGNKGEYHMFVPSIANNGAVDYAHYTYDRVTHKITIVPCESKVYDTNSNIQPDWGSKDEHTNQFVSFHKYFGRRYGKTVPNIHVVEGLTMNHAYKTGQNNTNHTDVQMNYSSDTVHSHGFSHTGVRSEIVHV